MQLPQLEALVDEIKTGKRVLPFPPGGFTLIGVIFTTLPAWVLCVSVLSEAFANEADIPVRAGLYLGGVFLLLPGTIIPGLLLLRGVKKAAIMMRFMLQLILLLTSVVVLFSFVDNDISLLLVPTLLAVALSVIGLMISYSPSFILLTEFCYLMRRKTD